jgi:hypothetical protein
MRALVVYESMYGNTHRIADAIAEGLAGQGDRAEGAADRVAGEAPAQPAGAVSDRAEVAPSSVEVRPLAELTPDLVASADLIVLGEPTHTWGMSRPATRESAISHSLGTDLHVEEHAADPGVREWLEGRPTLSRIALFDTRFAAPVVFTGRASRPVARLVRELGGQVIGDPQSFLVTRANVLVDGELARARRWGADLAVSVR